MIKVKNFSKLFENSESKKYKKLSWVPIPNKHDGSGYRRIVAMKNGCEIYTAWILILQVASKMPVRGELSDEDGELTTEDLSFKTGFPEKIFFDAIKVLSGPKIGWLEVSHDISEDIRKSPESPEENAVEQNRTEQNRINKKGFKKPTILEISEYCKERKNTINPEYYFDYCEARGWRLTGGKKMVSWKANIRTWERNNFSNGAVTSTGSKKKLLSFFSDKQKQELLTDLEFDIYSRDKQGDSLTAEELNKLTIISKMKFEQ